ncbi:response regulator transcription factor [Streptomyces sp. NPDC087437]|uniref:response regulator transcription factor n=1 Tax=Streptomyces sp. NPDC087437 TaxID=3365789 RepID=UPI0037F4DBA8
MITALRKHMLRAADELDLPLSVKQVTSLANRVVTYAARGPAPELLITPHHYAVLVGLASGESSGETGSRLGVSAYTIKSHRQRLYETLGATNAAHAVAIAKDLGILRTAAVEERKKDTSAGTQPAAGESTADFFQPGHTYQHSSWQFRCAAITADPETGERTAIGWFRFRQGQWRLFSADRAMWNDVWTDTADGGS